METLAVEEGVVQYTCNVINAGSGGDGTVYIGLQEVRDTFSRFFNASGEGGQKILDAALTAISGHLTVTAYLTSTDPNSEIYALYVNATTE
jgi:hypothetical protein